MATVSTLVVASMEVNADGVSVSGQVERKGTRFLVVVEGQHAGSASSLRPALQELVGEIRRRLPRGNPSDWGVLVRCSTNAFSIAYGNRARGGGGGRPLDPCVERALESYPRDDSFAHALEHGVQVLARCCG